MTVRRHLAALLVATCVTAWFSYGCFHNDEYFQVLELTRWKLDPSEVAALPWEIGQRLRPWLQPFMYWTVGRALSALGVRDVFQLAFVYRLLTGLASVGAVTLFLRTTLPWQRSGAERRVHLRVVTLLGCLPYLFVRTSSETGSMIALTAAFAVLLDESHASDRGTWSVPALAAGRGGRIVVAGALFGLAFEMRFQTALIAVSVAAWLYVVGRAPASATRTFRGVGLLSLGGMVALAAGALVDRWGYGVWTFPAWGYFRVNIIEGAAAFFGTSPPFAYLWMLPANVFLPVVVALLMLALLAWLRSPWHPVSWATLPFFVAHNLIAHKEERFLFPMAILATAFVTMALGPSHARSLEPLARPSVEVIARWGWDRRWRWPGKILVATSFAAGALLAFVPLGWNHNVRFTRFLHDAIGNELHAIVLPEVDLNLPAFHPGVYDVEKLEPEEVVRRIESGTARDWLITDRPTLRGSGLDGRATLVFSELLVYRDPALAERAMAWIDAYNANVGVRLRPLRFRALYRIDLAPPKATASRANTLSERAADQR